MRLVKIIVVMLPVAACFVIALTGQLAEVLGTAMFNWADQ
jgi:hypothetical protein